MTRSTSSGLTLKNSNGSSKNALLAGLNEAQREAVLHKNGPFLIAAGAGSGKTRVLTHRIAYLIADGVKSDQILALTFTNKAAQEMKERVTRLLGGPTAKWRSDRQTAPWIGTFHSLGAWILRRNAKAIGLNSHFTILDEEDRFSLIKDTIKELKLDLKQFQPSRIKSLISQKKGGLISLDDFREEANDYFSRTLREIWQRYEDKLKTAHALDFDDLLTRTLMLLKTRPDILSRYQKQWKFILIDEYQDTDHVQYILANLLAKLHSNLCVVGDVDQAIYSWRGADFRNILQFEDDWSQAKVITLEENYRSFKPILEAANAVIIKNVFRKPKNLFTKQKEGEKLELACAQNEDEEAQWIARCAKDLLERGVKPHAIAVLFRTNAQSRVLEEKFLGADIPYYVVGVKFYARKEIKDILAYLRASLNPHDLISIKRIINIPGRGIGKVLMAKYLSRSPLTDAEKRKIHDFETLLLDIKHETEKLPASDAIKATLKKTNYLDLFSLEVAEDVMRIGNIKELVTLAKRFDQRSSPEGILTLLEEAALMSEQDTMQDKAESIPLTTVHAAKGLEFDHVFIAGLEDGLFPHIILGGLPMQTEKEQIRLEEERRLFYVALTRARKKVWLSLALFRTVFGEKQVNMPSRFLKDIPSRLINYTEAENTIELL